MNRTILTLTSLLLVGACGSTHRWKAENYNKAFMSGNYCLSAEEATGEKICAPDLANIQLEDIGLLDSLNGGSALFVDQKYQYSSLLLDSADRQIYGDETSSVVTDAGKTAVGVIGNDSIFDYRPMVLDGIYLSSYKILNYLALNDLDSARSEVNRSYRRQQAASETFRKEILEEKKAAEAQAKELTPEAKEQAGDFQSEILSTYNEEFAQWNSYKDYLNPYTTYLSGLYYLAHSTGAADRENAVTYLKRVSGMSPQNKFVKQDLRLAQNAANGKIGLSKKQPSVWVIFENGMVADFREFRLDLPVFIATDQVKMVSFAIPTPRVRDAAFENLSVGFDQGKKVQTQLLADVDRMFISEYNKKFPIILSKAIASTTAKTVMQYLAQQQLGDLGGISMAVYSVTTTAADLRSWYGLPKNVQLAKIPVAKNGKLNIFNQDQKLAEVEVPKDKNSIVYVRIPDAKALPAVSVINL